MYWKSYLPTKNKMAFIVAILLIVPTGVWALNTLNTGYKVGSAPVTVDAHGICKVLQATDGNNYFVPTNTATEWSTFLTNKPAAVTAGPCVNSCSVRDQLVTGSVLSCALTPNHTVSCWTYTGAATPSLLTGTYSALANDQLTGTDHLCGLKLDGTLECVNSGVPAYAPSGTFKTLSVSYSNHCAVSTTGAGVCWGKYAQIMGGSLGNVSSPTGIYKDISTSPLFSCGIHTDNSISCWGAPGKAPTAASLTIFDGGVYDSIDTTQWGGNVVCAVTTSGKAVCNGMVNSLIIGATAGSFSAAETYRYIQSSNGLPVCGLRLDNTMDCPGISSVFSGTLKTLLGNIGISSTGQIVGPASPLPLNNSNFGCN